MEICSNFGWKYVHLPGWVWGSVEDWASSPKLGRGGSKTAQAIRIASIKVPKTMQRLAEKEQIL